MADHLDQPGQRRRKRALRSPGRQQDRAPRRGRCDSIRWSFSDISDQSFVWTGERLGTDGTGRKEAEFRLRRIVSVRAALPGQGSVSRRRVHAVHKVSLSPACGFRRERQHPPTILETTVLLANLAALCASGACLSRQRQARDDCVKGNFTPAFPVARNAGPAHNL